MADPISLAAGVVGILTAAAQISSLLIDFTRSSKDAPQTARAVLTEVDDISSTLSHLQSFLLGNEYSDRSRTQLLQVDQVVTIISGCVLTFSELEKLLDGLKAEGMGILDRVHWARKEKAISNLVQRLQNHKGSLSLILHVLNGNTIIEAKNSVDRLHGMIGRCYQEMSSRMEAFELRDLRRPELSSVHHQSESDTSSVLTIKAPRTDSFTPDPASTSSSAMVASDFIEALQKSWVYRRNNALDVDRLSIYSRDTCSMTWSCISGISWAEVSNISVIGLPVLVGEVYNSLRSSQTWSNDTVDPVSPITPAFELAARGRATTQLSKNKNSSAAYPIWTIAYDDGSCPCKGCGLALQGGKIFKIWGFMWHQYCFRCNTCRSLVESHAYLQCLEDGSLFCVYCRYYCSLCAEIMGDLAILTDNSAFCGACFKCRHCKMENQDLRYARTSQGLFCMVCHDNQMARRRKKSSLQQEESPALPKEHMRMDHNVQKNHRMTTTPTRPITNFSYPLTGREMSLKLQNMEVNRALTGCSIGASKAGEASVRPPLELKYVQMVTIVRGRARRP